MAVLPRRPRLVALVQLAVVLWLAAASGCLCRLVLPPHHGFLPTPPLSPPPPPPPPPNTPPPPPRRPFPPSPSCRFRPFCRRPPPVCPPEGCAVEGGPP